LGIFGDFDNAKKQFKLNVKNYIQAIANGNIENNGLVISPRFFINSAERIVFNGKNTINKYQPKLILTYTKH
jgi:lysophospholipase L1-like esterase